MALKPDRNIVDDSVSYFVPGDYDDQSGITYGGTRGGVVVSTGATPSGAALDQTVNGAWYIGAPSGETPIGMLMNDVVAVDLTRQILNPYKSEAQVGDKVSIMRKGWAVTSSVDTTTGTVVVGGACYLGPSGNLSADSGGLWGSGIGGAEPKHPLVGKWLSGADEDGYYKVYIDL